MMNIRILENLRHKLEDKKALEKERARIRRESLRISPSHPVYTMSEIINNFDLMTGYEMHRMNFERVFSIPSGFYNWVKGE